VRVGRDGQVGRKCMHPAFVFGKRGADVEMFELIRLNVETVN